MERAVAEVPGYRDAAGGGSKSVDLDLLRAAVIELDPDILALQEVDRSQSRSQHADLAEVAAEAMGAKDYRFVPTLAGTPGAMWAMSPTASTGRRVRHRAALPLSRHPLAGHPAARLCVRRSG